MSTLGNLLPEDFKAYAKTKAQGDGFDPQKSKLNLAITRRDSVKGRRTRETLIEKSF